MHRAGSHARDHNLALYCLGVKLLTSLRKLEEVDLESLGRWVGNLVGQEAALRSV